MHFSVALSHCSVSQCKDTLCGCRVAVIGQKFQDSADQKEPWYGTNYSIEDISENTLDQWSNAGFHPNLNMPLPNEFIPTDFELATPEERVSIVSIL